MLFETVYGPELECAFNMIAAHRRPTTPLSRTAFFVATVPDGASGQVKNMHDALAFLRSARLIREDEGWLRPVSDGPFRPVLLRSLRSIVQDDAAPPQDRLYLQLVHDLFVHPDRLYRTDLHDAVNVVSASPLTQERVNAWARVLEYLGLGWRIGHGFQCVYSPALILDLLAACPPGLYGLNSLADEYLTQYLPVYTRSGILAQALHIALYALHEQRLAHLVRLQDAPGQALGPEGYTHLRLSVHRRARLSRAGAYV